MSRLARLAALVAGLLADANVIEERRLRETVDLSWPRVVTGFAIMSKRTVDLAIVGVAVGETAVAGLTVANAYWTVGKLLFIGLAGGTLSLVSQNVGGGDDARATGVVRASLLAAFVLSLPLAAAFGLGAEPLAGLVGGGEAATGHAAVYLAVVAPGLVFEALNLVASRTYAGVGNTTTPMAVRALGAALNVALSATFVFAFDLGVFGAGLGTTLSTLLVAVVFAWGMTGRSYAGRGASPLPVFGASVVDRRLVGQLGRVSAPLVARRVAQGVVVFPLLAVAATFGPVVLAAVGVARQVRQLLNSFTWGFSIAASTLVGQALGRGDEDAARAYGREITTLSAVVYLLAAALVVALSRPIASVFVGPDAVGTTALFVAVAAGSAVALGVDGSVTGTLRGAGDTRVPFVATLAGLYLVALPLAGLGVVTSLGATALLFALLAETGVPVLVNVWRFRTGAWVAVSRAYRPDADSDPGD
ncbi:MATE family efflux transporter [Halosegnis marinus]|uniref:Multidrug-efflux transporter n=1 Tax=Halosegnis marinus TaxID=3034023 RepID=A0ABD5ZM27_9EURY|nr:MATE family efflux transporter [Halosegnis sp. DT85]